MSAVRTIRKSTTWDRAAERFDRAGLPAAAQMFRNEAFREQEARDEYEAVVAQARLQHEAAKKASAY